MASQQETITITIAGVNPQTLTVLVDVDPTKGIGSTTFSYTGTAGGTDTLQATATIAGTNYTSPPAQVAWQDSNGQVQVGNIVTCYAWNDSPQSGPVAAYTFKKPQDEGKGTPRTIMDTGVTSNTNNSLAFDAYNGGGLPGNFPLWSTLTSSGGSTTGISWPQFKENFNCIILANLVVPAAGYYTLNLMYKDTAIWGIGTSASSGTATWSPSHTGGFGQTMTVNGGFPLLNAPPLKSGEDWVVGNASTSVYFSAPGIYPTEIDWDYWYHKGRQLHVTVLGQGEVAPVSLVPAPPPATTPTGNLNITPTGGPTNLQVINNSITLEIVVSGIVYPTMSYVPVLEGVSGSISIYNDPTSNTFTFPTYNGSAVDKTAAAASAFSLSGDNSAWNGLFSVGYDGTAFNLNYNGHTANPSSTSRILATSLTVAADDIAWFNDSNKAFDLYNISGSTGGNTGNLEINYMTKPAVASVSPLTIIAAGGTCNLSITLTKAFSPQQQGAKNTGNTINCSCTIPGATVLSTTPVYDSLGWLTGWDVQFTAPISSNNQTLAVNLTVSGTLTYLSGNTFVTGTVYYIGTSTTPYTTNIVAQGITFVPPTAQGFTATPSATSINGATTSMVLTAQVFTTETSDALTVTFFSQVVGSSAQTTITGTVTQLSSVPATVGGVTGYLQTFTLTFNPQVWVSPGGSYLGFNVVDIPSTLTCNYATTAAYSIPSSEGINSCPALGMFLSPVLQVAEASVGTEVDAIISQFEAGDYKLVEKKLPVQWLKYSDEVCYHFVTANGAEVVVSESTPIPTKEVFEAIVAGYPHSGGYLASEVREGMHVLTDVGEGVEWSLLTQAIAVGIQRVARLYIGGENFAAGVTADKRIYTHNAGVSGTPGASQK